MATRGSAEVRALAAFLVAWHAAAQAAGPFSCSEAARYVQKLALYGPEKAGSPRGFGAGLFLAKDGTFLTARHIFEEAAQATRAVVEIRGGGRRLCPVEAVLAESAELDAVILRVRIPSGLVRVPRLAAAVRAGETLIGFRVAPPYPGNWSGPDGVVCSTGTVTSVSAAGIEARGPQLFVPGSSGSPLFDGAGGVVGIALAMIDADPRAPRPQWKYAGLRIEAAMRTPRYPRPVPLAEFLATLRRERNAVGGETE